MTTTANEQHAEALGARIQQCAAWRWRPGMLALSGVRVTSALYPSGIAVGVTEPAYHEVRLDPDDVPDLRDPATRGAVLDLVRAAHGDPLICAVAHRSDDGPVRWWIDSDQCPVDDLYAYDSEAEALVAALEAAGGGES